MCVCGAHVVSPTEKVECMFFNEAPETSSSPAKRPETWYTWHQSKIMIGIVVSKTSMAFHFSSKSIHMSHGQNKRRPI